MDDLSGLISSFLEKPENVEKLKSLAGLFKGGGDSEPERDEPREEQDTVKNADTALSAAIPSADALQSALSKMSRREHDPRIALLYALKPYLSDKRLGYLDSAIKLLSISGLFTMFDGKL